MVCKIWTFGLISKENDNLKKCAFDQRSSVVLVASGPLAHVQSGNVPKGMAKSPRGQRTHQLEYIERWNQPGVLWQRRGAGLADLPLSLKACQRKTPQISGRSTRSALTGQNTYNDDDNLILK